MKITEINKILTILMIGWLITSCTEEITREPSPIQTSGIQAYLYTPKTDVTFTPDQEQVVQVTVSRAVDSEAATVNLKIDDPSSAFTIPSSVSFAAGESEKTLSATSNIALTESATLTIVVPEDDRYWYGIDSLTITVTNDYTWLSMGTVSFTSDWAGGTADLSIQKSKEANIYRILSPYYYLEPTYCPNPGYHLYFRLDDNYNAESVISSDIGETASGGGDWWLYWDATKYPSYCTFTNTGNSYVIGGLWAYGETSSTLTPKYVAAESFVWTEGYPGN